MPNDNAATDDDTCETSVHRRHFLTLTGGVLAFASVRSHPAAGQPLDLQPPLRIRLFSGMDIVRLEAAGITVDAASGTMTAAGGTQALGSQVVELSANPAVAVTALTRDGTTLARRYPGAVYVQLRADALQVVNLVDLETYVASVLSSEVSPNWPTESLRAQAIVVRTYATHARLAARVRDYDLSDDTSAQVYRGVDALAPSLLGAADDTRGQIVSAAGVPAEVFYSSSCGGHTASSSELSGLPAPSYLAGVWDLDPSGRAYCANAPYFRWKNSVSAEAMSRIVGVPADQLNGIAVAERWPDGRVRTVSFSGAGTTTTMDGRTFYSRALAQLGYKVIPSALFEVSRDGASFDFVGHGVGHGVGMCQWGAHGRADAGMNATQILGAYFPGTTIVRG